MASLFVNGELFWAGVELSLEHWSDNAIRIKIGPTSDTLLKMSPDEAEALIHDLTDALSKLRAEADAEEAERKHDERMGK